MRATYGDKQIETLKTRSEFEEESKLGWQYKRSTELQNVDTMLDTIHQFPTVKNFDLLKQRYDTWFKLKAAKHKGVAKSKRGTAANVLASQISAIGKTLRDRKILMERIETLLSDELTWKRKCLCAELYDKGYGKWAENGKEGIMELCSTEVRMSSGWANVAPTDIAGWHTTGTSDAQTVIDWPRLAMKTKIVLNSHLQRSTHFEAAQLSWPPWAENEPHRKGLYCHSSAAIAIALIHAHRAELQGGLACKIRSIDAVHQQPVATGEMSHWWVAVNRPDKVELAKGRTLDFGKVGDFSCLPLLGGFVVDMWGALWLDQKTKAVQRASDTIETDEPCVQDEPFIQLGSDLKNEKVVNKLHHVYKDIPEPVTFHMA